MFKRNRFLLVYYGFYLALVVLVTLEVDRQYYQNEKKELINDNIEKYLFEPVPDLHPAATDGLAKLAGQAVAGRNQQPFREKVREIINREDTIVYRIEIREGTEDADAAVYGESASSQYIENREKLRQLNKYSNSLILRDFSSKLSYPVGENSRVYYHFTSPVGDPAVEELTRSYRIKLVVILVGLTLLAAIPVGGLLLPLGRVTSALESSTAQRTDFCRRPRTRLETLYNRMALEAVISRLQSKLRDEIAHHPHMTGWEVVCFIARSFNAQVNLPLIGCLELVAKGPGDMKPTGQAFFCGASRMAKLEEGELARRVMEAWEEEAGEGTAEVELIEAGEELAGQMELTNDPERAGFRYLFVMAMKRRNYDDAGQMLEGMHVGVAGLVESGLQGLALRTQLVVKERGRANISLSRNLGHDLTNIIATSKLELMAVERLLRKGELPPDDRRRRILLESMQGLLQSVKFMQETVNLYRAYAFLQHPVLETYDGNKLVGDTLDLFSMSMSAKMQLRRELAEEAPRCVVDPRLIKLALFNMFSNSLRAIRKADPEHTPEGWIKAITRRSRDNGLCIAIEDSGTGILMGDGRKAEAHEIEKIFDLGYSNKDSAVEEGEGLGLNWVRTIIEELHGGTIHAENTEDAGARFVIVLPPIEKAPSMENAERRAAAFMRQFQRKLGVEENGDEGDGARNEEGEPETMGAREDG